MAKKLDEHQFQGMQRDSSISKQQPKFLWDARNIRLTARNGDTLMSITNEKGTSESQSKSYNVTSEEYTYTPVEIKGSYVGHCTIGNYLTVFTHSIETNQDYIYRIEKKNNGYFDVVTLYGNDATNHKSLGFSLDHPIQTLGIYENDKIQKVYWTDNYNQPRFINIVKTNPSYDENSFDFVPKMTLNDSISVRKITNSSGIFGAGIIQYMISYYNKYGQESNISCSSPLIATSFTSRAGNAEEKIGNSFEIHIKNPDKSFDYLRIYSIFRSSIDATPDAKRVVDIKLSQQNEYIKINEQLLDVAQFVDDPVYKEQFSDKNWNTLYDGGFDTTEDIVGTIVTNGLFYVVKKSNYPNIILKVPENSPSLYYYVTWGDADTLYISRDHNYTDSDTNKIHYGDYVFGTKTTTNEDGNECITSAKFSVSAAIEVNTNNNEVIFIDNGTIGDSIEASELLYIGGETIKAGTIEQKDGTLFMGNIEVLRPTLDSTLKKQFLKPNKDTTPYASIISVGSRSAYIPLVLNDNTYQWGSSLNAKIDPTNTATNISTAGFKYGEHYRLGIQFQYESGKWSEPVFIGDFTNDSVHPALEIQNSNYQKLTIPIFKGHLDAEVVEELYGLGYRRVRGLVVFPSMQDRLITAQGVLAPSVYSVAFRENKSPYFQSSWFFRPWPSTNSNYIENDDSVDTKHILYGSSVEYRHEHTLYGFNNRGAEIQGVPNGWGGKLVSELPTFVNESTLPQVNGSDATYMVTITKDQEVNIFAVDQQNVTMHSPDFEFDTSFSSLDFSNQKIKLVGYTNFSSNIGTIDIQTSTPQIHGSGFYKKTLICTRPIYADKRLCAGLFYKDFLVDDNVSSEYAKWPYEKYEFGFLIYPWHRTGSLNNDAVRPSGEGTRTALLSQKKISNIKYATDTYYIDTPKAMDLFDNNSIQLFSSDQVSVVKTGEKTYYGNVDELLTPVASYGIILGNGDNDSLTGSVTEDNKSVLSSKFTDKSVKFWASNRENYAQLQKAVSGEMFDYFRFHLVNTVSGIGKDNENPYLRLSNETISMKYKSTPHVVVALDAPLDDKENHYYPRLFVSELYKDPNPDIDFGGTTDEAIQANLWIPAGDPVPLKPENENSFNDVDYNYSYGDTWYQRYDCLKTYAFTEEDTNSVIEIGSFIVETRVNIDGRYDKNRGQDDNLSMSPTNFNLINPVYSQSNNFFNYRILDSDYYDLNKYTSMITWSKFKNNASDVDSWTTVNLSSTLEVDGTHGEVTDIATYKDSIYAFQQYGITQILFNSRVMVNTTDGVPIEISNNYKVDGDRYISTSVGCNDKFSVAKSPNGIYFVDSIGKTLYILADNQLTNLSDTHGFGYWFSQQDTSTLWNSGCIAVRNSPQIRPNSTWPYGCDGIKLEYDFNNNDLYIMTKNDVLCYSELLGQFISFMDYKGATTLFNITNTFHALVNVIPSSNGGDRYMKLWNMFDGEYNKLLGRYTESSITFVSNLEPTLDKIFTNLELRGDFYSNDKDFEISPDQNLDHFQIFDEIRVWNEYQDTGVTKPNFKKKFRIWRCDIPRALKAQTGVDEDGNVVYTNKRGMDRIRNTWCKIQLTMNKVKIPWVSHRMELHDVGVIYYG